MIFERGRGGGGWGCRHVVAPTAHYPAVISNFYCGKSSLLFSQKLSTSSTILILTNIKINIEKYRKVRKCSKCSSLSRLSRLHDDLLWLFWRSCLFIIGNFHMYSSIKGVKNQWWVQICQKSKEWTPLNLKIRQQIIHSWF